ncbi:retrovirus-related Pol polyprotein from transposon 17.6 [Trichonephila clavipes]|nr:retrovirus-related Pol polyprotein from transposon 17.6 [Trichonephila clavipes]
MEEVSDRRKKWYDKNAIKRELLQGDAVLVLTLNQPHKLAPQWKGPDASDQEYGVVLTQKDDNGEEHPILFLSKKFTATERTYFTTEKECAAILYTIKKLKGYVDGQTEFYIQTDHSPLVGLKNKAGNNG